ncbi:ATP-binding cassette domain-containing protein [Conexibacter sp. CPCC 206217]|uniref:ATP-binding cassette domain-containing protein n=1 Tax=Conexibacter sp. CPCC 206217 TaxID=3064574 RepID=UPI00271DAB7F|nr:ATP-binding cassette domain-containing protein [Conexibacter sp. CPCC 206217]MDO8209625.1 ATP-binding cassette domain-containing protein [Conexibacter sp. CPCC 206217]
MSAAVESSAAVEPPRLEFRNATRRFGAVTAAEGVSFSVHGGECVAVVGDNGAGKTTLMNLASGVFPPSSGTIAIDGAEVSLGSPTEARDRGIETIFQDLACCENLDAAANIFLGRELRLSRRWGSRLARKAMREQARETLKTLDIELKDIDAPIRVLSGGQKKAVAIARAVHWQARLVIMDEPSAALGVPEQRKVAELIGTLKRSGLGVVLVSHSMPEVFEVADRIVVMLRGHKVADMRCEETSIEEVVRLMVGGAHPVPHNLAEKGGHDH